MPGTRRRREEVPGGGEGSQTKAKPATEGCIPGQLRKIADQLGIPEQGQSKAQLALDIHLILKVG